MRPPSLTLLVLLVAAGMTGCYTRPKDGFGIDGPYGGNVTITASAAGTSGISDARFDTVAYSHDALSIAPGCTVRTYPSATQSVDADERGQRDGAVDTTKDIEYEHAVVVGQSCTIDTVNGPVTFSTEHGNLVFLRSGQLDFTIGGQVSSASIGPGGYATFQFSGTLAE